MSSTPNGQASAGVIDPVDTRKGGLPLLMAVLLAAAVAFQLNASMLSPVLTTMAHELNTVVAAVVLSQSAFFTGGAMVGLVFPSIYDLIVPRVLHLIRHL